MGGYPLCCYYCCKSEVSTNLLRSFLLSSRATSAGSGQSHSSSCSVWTEKQKFKTKIMIATLQLATLDLKKPTEAWGQSDLPEMFPLQIWASKQKCNENLYLLDSEGSQSPSCPLGVTLDPLHCELVNIWLGTWHQCKEEKPVRETGRLSQTSLLKEHKGNRHLAQWLNSLLGTLSFHIRMPRLKSRLHSRIQLPVDARLLWWLK